MIPEIFNSIEPALLLFFLLFLIAAYVIFKVVSRAIIFMFLGAMFPFFLKYVMHMNVVISIQTILYYAILAGSLYLIYLLFKTTVTVIKAGALTLKLVLLPFRIIASVIKSASRLIKGGGEKRDKNYKKEKKKKSKDSEED